VQRINNEYDVDTFKCFGKTESDRMKKPGGDNLKVLISRIKKHTRTDFNLQQIADGSLMSDRSGGVFDI